MKKPIPMLDLQAEYQYMKNDIDEAIRQCLDHQQWILGPEVKELEDRVTEYIGVKHCIGISSGTDALLLSLRALAIKLYGKEYFSRSDEIITTPFTFTATGDSILRAGAKPVFVDINPATYNLDESQVESYIEKSVSRSEKHHSRVIGILPVHLYGQACNMDRIMEIAAKHKLFVIEDVAQAFGSAWNGKKLGSLGLAGAFSFFPSKNLGGFGDGGMVSTNDNEMAELIRILLKHGGINKYDVDHIGYNGRLDTLQAAVLLAKFKYLDEFNKRRIQLASIYSKELSDIKDLILPDDHSQNTNTSPNRANKNQTGFHVYHQYTVRTSKRDALQQYLQENGVSSMVYYPVLLNKMKVFKHRMKVWGTLDNAREAALSVLSLPIEPLQAAEETAFVASKVRSFFSEKGPCDLL